MAHEIKSEPAPGGRLVAISGEVDALGAPGLDDAIRAATLEVLAGDRGRTIVIDLSETTFVDSRTIGILVSWTEQLRPKGWRVPIVCRDPNLLRLFGTIGLQDTLEFHETREAALAGTLGADSGGAGR